MISNPIYTIVHSVEKSIYYIIFFIISYSFLREGFVQGSDWSRSLGVAFWSANEM